MSEFKTDLGDYILWFDGVIEIDPSAMEGLFLKGIDPKRIAVSEISPDIEKYNRLSKDKITTKEEVDADLISFDWNIPKEYLELNIVDHVCAIAKAKLVNLPPSETAARCDRIERELIEYEKRGLLDVLKVLIYTIDQFKKNKVVWGVGRGSSCASYILYLLEVHSVDPIKYEIPLEEFFK